MTNDVLTRRLLDLANYLECCRLPRSSRGSDLLYSVSRSGGYSVLGVVCEFHRTQTNNGRWSYPYPSRLHNPVYETLDPPVQSSIHLPGPVIDYIGLRTCRGDFKTEDVSRSTMRMLRAFGPYNDCSLLDISRYYTARPWQIAAAVIRDLPASLVSFAPPN